MGRKWNPNQQRVTKGSKRQSDNQRVTKRTKRQQSNKQRETMGRKWHPNQQGVIKGKKWHPNQQREKGKLEKVIGLVVYGRGSSQPIKFNSSSEDSSDDEDFEVQYILGHQDNYSETRDLSSDEDIPMHIQDQVDIGETYYTYHSKELRSPL